MLSRDPRPRERYPPQLDGLTSRLFQIRPLPAIGRISYGLYLWHLPVATLLHGRVPTRYYAQLTLVMALTFAAAILSAMFVEEPVLRRVKARLRDRSASTAQSPAHPAGPADAAWRPIVDTATKNADP